MSIASKIESISNHLENAYNSLENIGVDLEGINKNIENLSAQIESVYDILPQETQEGECINLTSTKRGKIKIQLKANDIKQLISTGKNKLDKDNLTNLGSGNTIGVILDTGIRTISSTTSTSPSSNQAIKYLVGDIEDYISQTITLSAYAKSSSTNQGFMYLRLCKENGDVSNDYGTITTSPTLDGKISVSYTIPSGIGEYHYLMIALYSTRNSAVQKNDYVDYTKLQLEINNTSTEYEPYTNSIITPSTNAPQNIRTITGNNNFYICKKNLLKITESSLLVHCSYVSGANTNQYKIKCTANDMYVNEVKNKESSYTVACGNLIACNFDENVYFNTGNNLFNKNFFTEFDENLISLGNYSVSTSNGTYTPKNWNCKYITLRFGYGSPTVDTVYTLAPIICKISDTTYESYYEQNLSLTLDNLEYCKINNNTDIIFKNIPSDENYDVNKELNKWYMKKNIEKITDESGSTGTTLTNMINNEKAYSYYGGTVNNATITYDNPIPNNNIIYYPVQTPSYILLSETLQNELNNIEKALSYTNETHISQISSNLPFIINATILKEVTD